MPCAEVSHGYQNVCWHAARVLHRCSLLFPPEAPCERMGSFLRLQWDPRRHLGPVSMGDLVLLSQAGVRGDGNSRDESIVDGASDCMFPLVWGWV
jgi:hypothetical protein